MFPDVLVHRLKMIVDPADSSYMPSLVVVSGGNSLNNLIELKTININPADTTVSLLSDCTEVSGCDRVPFDGSQMTMMR